MATPPGYHTRGLRFRKVDLHLHTPASRDFGEQSVTPGDILAQAQTRGLEAIAITDHNTGLWVDDMKTAARAHGIVVFPGVEITCSAGAEGLHIIALFNPSCARSHVEGLLSELGLRPEGYGDLNAIVQKTAIEAVELIYKRDALPILAHINSTRGVFREMKGQQRIALIQHPFVLGAEATDFQNLDQQSRHKRAVDLLDGNDPDYRRHMAVYQASDNPSLVSGQHGLDGIGKRCAYFKMDKIDLDALRQCLADPEVRIRQDFEYKVQAYPYIKSLRITGGFLDGSQATFHDGLNSILGAKGAGKSLLVEFMRFALDQPPSHEDIREDHDGKLAQRLEDYGSVELMLVDETGKDLTLTRVYDPADANPYEDSAHDDISQVFPVLFLSQNEIIRIAESEDEQISFIDRFFDFRSYQGEISNLEDKIGRLDLELAESLRATRSMKDIEKRLRLRAEDLRKIDVGLKNPAFDDFTRLESKDRSLREQRDYLKSLIARLNQAIRDVPGTSPPPVPKPVEADPALRRALERSGKARELALRAIEGSRDEVANLLLKGEEDYQRWVPSFQEGRKRYEEAIQKEGGDYKALAQQRTRVVKDQEALELRSRTVGEVAGRLEQISGERKALLTEIRSAYEKYTAERKQRCARMEGESNGKLHVRIHEASNVDEFRERLMTLKRGSHVRDVDIERVASSVDPGLFMRSVIKYSVSANPKHLDEVMKTTKLDLQHIQTLADFLTSDSAYETLLALEYKAIPQDRPEIRYNIGEGKYELLSNLSVGQKCTAMLMIALSEGAMPIIIDQPEDSLDLRTIWDDICQKVRRGKETRQFIFTTHNSSVAVASDTDKFIIVEGGATKGAVVFSGSMDHQPVSSQALKYLEGDTQTYKAKYRKYRGDQIVT